MKTVGRASVAVLVLALVVYTTVGHHTSFFGGGGYGGGFGGGYGSSTSYFGSSYTNRTVLCALKGGTCVTTTTSCVGTLKFNCENLALCCFNTTTPFKFVVKKIFLGKRRSRGYGNRRGGYGSRRRW